jgi:hypothetical protein
MTQHYLTPTFPEIADMIMVGYDRTFASFFAQVYKDTDDEPTFIVDEGYPWAPLTNVDQVIDLVDDYAHIPDELRDALADDHTCAPTDTMEEASAVTRWSTTGRVEPERQLI